MAEGSFPQLVVVGSSAGGIEALSRLVAQLPEDFAAPVVLAQHLHPDHKSRLEQILSRHSKLPVRTVNDLLPLEGGVVFAVPANRHVRITDSDISVQEDTYGRPKPSIDVLMKTAAEVYGERLIAVVLTGTGSDGNEGARAVKEAGGTVVVQDPETVEFGGMPRSLAPNTVDINVPLEAIGGVLQDLLAQDLPKEQSQTEEVRLVGQFLEELREERGLDFTGYKTPTILRRLKRRMVATRTDTIEEYTAYLHNNQEEYRQLVQTFLIKVTEFFRDPDLFAYLKEEVLPALIETAGKDDHQLRVWSAGCATGEEAYSLAILIREVLGEENRLFNVRIFATDIDDEAIEFARQGLYPPPALKGLSEEQIETYFEREGSQYQVNKNIRSMIVFGEHDLASRSPFPRIDLVVCRNVLIYFTPELQRRALQLFAYSLRDGRYLVLGKAETTSPLNQLFVPDHPHQKVYRRRGERFLMPPAVAGTSMPAARKAPRDPQRDDPQRGDPQRDLRREAQARWEDSFIRRDLSGQHPANDNFLDDLPVGVVVVDRRYDIQAINAAARRLLSIHNVTAVGEDFLHLLRDPPYAEVRRAIDAALRDGGRARTSPFAVENVVSGEPSYLELVCYPRWGQDEEGPARVVSAVVLDITEAVRERQDLESRLKQAREDLRKVRSESEAEAARQEAQNKRLVEANSRLEEANRELTDLNEKLRSTNEEFLLSAEEAQASTEEVETLNEELQATNEELETLNEELQATVEELNTTNNELQARSAELQEVARNREEERKRSETSRRLLEAVLAGIDDPVLAVDEAGEVLFTNEAFQETFGSRDGRPAALPPEETLLDGDGRPLAAGASLKLRASHGESFDLPFTVQSPAGEKHRFEARGRPIQDGDTKGGVVVIRRAPDDPGSGGPAASA